MPRPFDRTYLGDGVYVRVERGMVELTTSDGVRDTNVIFLEPEVLDAVRSMAAREREEGP